MMMELAAQLFVHTESATRLDADAIAKHVGLKRNVKAKYPTQFLS